MQKQSKIQQLRLQIAICDDDETDLQEIAGLTREILQEERTDCEISVYADGNTLLSAIQNGRQFHILLLDVMMEQPDGMQLAAALRKQKNDVSIIFISINREMAMQGYVVAASRYLSKPVDCNLLREALLFCRDERQGQKEILISTAKGQGRIALSDICYVETWNRGVRLILSDGTLESSMRMAELADILPSPPFVLCHRTILVNLSWVRYIRYCELELKSGDVLPISKYRFSNVRKELLHYLKKNESAL